MIFYGKVAEAISELHKRGIIKTYYLEKDVDWNKRGSKPAKRTMDNDRGSK